MHLAGTAVFIINYTGDRLNFGLAVERFNGSKRDQVNQFPKEVVTSPHVMQVSLMQ